MISYSFYYLWHFRCYPICGRFEPFEYIAAIIKDTGVEIFGSFADKSTLFGVLQSIKLSFIIKIVQPGQ